MNITKRGEGTWEVESESSTRRYIVSWGTEGDFYSCQCHAYAFGRNKAGGIGHKFVCKHIRAVEQYEPVAEEIERKRADERKEATLANLLNLERRLRPNAEPAPEPEPEPERPMDALVADLEARLRGA